MMQKATLLWMAILVVSGLSLYEMKYAVREMRAESNRMEKALLKEQESLHVLKAEWAHLSSPERLQMLVDKYLVLTPVSGEQLATGATIKVKLESLAPPLSAAPNAVKEVGYDRR